MTKEEVKAGLLACAQKLSRTPTYAEVRQMTRITRFWIQKYFASMGHAFREAGVEPKGSGHRVETALLLEDWAGCARKLGGLPSISAYQKLGRFSVRPFFDRCNSWGGVPEKFCAWVREQQLPELEEKWSDVLAMIARRRQQVADAAFRMPAMEDGPSLPESPRARRKIRLDRPIYGAPLAVPGLRYEPVNEQGVVFAFGMMAHLLGLHLERMQQGFPDCEAVREVEPGKWQRMKIEIEFASRNFLTHKHPPEGCDMIVCWLHNWPECPESIEVIELRRLVRNMEHRNAIPADLPVEGPPAPQLPAMPKSPKPAPIRKRN
jgi:hypothetical protein